MVAEADKKPAAAEQGKPAAAQKGKDARKKKKGEEDKDAELSEEDLELKQKLELLVERIRDSNSGVQSNALQAISTEIRSATTSMTSVPKPLKFLMKHYDSIKAFYESMPQSDNKPRLADVISILAISSGKKGERESLKYRLEGSQEPLGSWGNEYVRNLAGEIGQEFQERREADKPVKDLLDLVSQIVPYHMSHNAETEAVDLLLEVEELGWLEQYVDADNYRRTCLYLTSTSAYLPEPDDTTVLHTAFSLYTKVKAWPDAVVTALRLGDKDRVEQAVAQCGSSLDAEGLLQKQQLAYILAQQGFPVNFEDGPAAIPEDSMDATARTDAVETLTEIGGNARASSHYLSLARDLDVMEAKLPEEVYKSHLVEGRAPAGPAVDSARANLAATFVNGFVNAGFGTDKLVTPEPSSTSSELVHWIFKNKDHGKAAATASLGLITLWDVQGGLPLLDKYLYSKDPHVQAGCLLGIGIVNCCVMDEHDPAYALLYEAVTKDDTTVRLGAILGLGLAYAGKQREEVGELLIPLVADPELPAEVASYAALALGLVFVGTCHQDSLEAMLQALMMRCTTESSDLYSPWGKLLCLGLGLLYLGKQMAIEATLEVVKTLNGNMASYCSVVLETCAYAGTGDVLKIQQMLAAAGEHIETDEPNSWKSHHQSQAVLGLALVALGEDLGSGMAHRALEHLLRYGEPPVRRAVALAVALLHVSNPDMAALDTLSRLSHDADTEVAQSAVLALGIVGAGTNNARLAGILRGLSSYYYKEPTLLLLVRLAQGLVHLGKGLLTLAPARLDGQLLSGVALAGILTVLHASLDMKALLAGKHATLLYALTPAMRPRMLMTLDSEGRLLPVPVRVGQAVDVVAQAGRPKTITGFQTHTTPVLLNVGERAELATSKYLPLTSMLEGVVILKPNPEYIDAGE